MLRHRFAAVAVLMMTAASLLSPTSATSMRHSLLVVALLPLLLACSDAATRVARDLTAGATKLGAVDGSTISVELVPHEKPVGCPRAYTLQLSRASALLVWCQDSIGGISTSSHTTTSHIHAVTVSQTWIITKAMAHMLSST